MKLHLPSGLRRALLACLAAVALPTALPSTLASASGIAAISFLASQRAAAEFSGPGDVTWGNDRGPLATNVPQGSTNNVEGSDYFTTDSGKVGSALYGLQFNATGTSHSKNLKLEMHWGWITLAGDLSALDNLWLTAGSDTHNSGIIYIGDNGNGTLSGLEKVQDIWVNLAQLQLDSTLTNLTANFHVGKANSAQDNARYTQGKGLSAEATAATLRLAKSVTTTGYLEIVEDTTISLATGTTFTVGGLKGGSDAARTLTIYNPGALKIYKAGGASVDGQLSITGSLTMGGEVTLSSNAQLTVSGTLISDNLTKLTVSSTSHLRTGVSGDLAVDNLTIDGSVALALTGDAQLSFSSLSGAGSLVLDLTGMTVSLNGYRLFTGDISSWYNDWKDKISFTDSKYTLNADGTLTSPSLTWTGSGRTVTLGDTVSGEGWAQGGGTISEREDVVLQGTASGGITVTVSGGEDGAVKMHDLTIGADKGSSPYTFTASSAQTLSVGGSLTVNADTTFEQNVKLSTAAGARITLGGNLTLNGGLENLATSSNKVTFSRAGGVDKLCMVEISSGSNLNLRNGANPRTAAAFFGEGTGIVWNGTGGDKNDLLSLSIDATDFQGGKIEVRGGAVELMGTELDEFQDPKPWTSSSDLEIVAGSGARLVSIVGTLTDHALPADLPRAAELGASITVQGGELNLTYSMSISGNVTTSSGAKLVLGGYGNFSGMEYVYHVPFFIDLKNGGTVGGGMEWKGAYEIYLGDTLTITGGMTDSTSGDAVWGHAFYLDNDAKNKNAQVVDIVNDGQTVTSTSGLLVGAGLTFVKKGAGTQAFGKGEGTYAKDTNIAGKLDVQEGTLQLNGEGTISGELTGAGTLQVGAGGTLSITGGGDMSGTLEMSGGDLTVDTKKLSVGTLRLTTAGTLTVQGEMEVGKVDGTAALTTLTLSNTSNLTVNGGVLRADNIAFSPDSAGATLHLKVGATSGAQLSFSNAWNGKLTIQLDGWSDLADKVYQLFAGDDRYSSFWTKIQNDISKYFSFVDETGQEIEHLTLDSEGYLYFGSLQEWSGSGDLRWGTDSAWKRGRGDANQPYDPSLSVLFDGTSTPVTVTLTTNIEAQQDMTVQRGAGMGEEEQVYTFSMGSHSLTVGEKLTVREGVSAEFTGSGKLTVTGGTDVSGTLIVGTSGEKKLGEVQLQEGSSLVVKDNGNWQSTTVNGTGALVYDGVKGASLGTSLQSLLGDGFTGQIELRGGAALTQESDMTQLKNSSKLVIGTDEGAFSSLTFNAGGSTDHEIELRSKGEIVVSGSDKLTLGNLNAKDGKLTLSGALDVNFGENTSFSLLVVNSGGDLTTGLASGNLQFGDITLNSDLNLHLDILSDLTLGAESITGGHKINIFLSKDFLQLIADGITGKYKLFEGTIWTDEVVRIGDVDGFTVTLEKDGNISVTSDTPGTRDKFTGFVYHEADAGQTLKQNAEITISAGAPGGDQAAAPQLSFDEKSKSLLNVKLVADATGLGDHWYEFVLNGDTSFTGLNSVYFTGNTGFLENGNFAGGGPKTIYIKDGQLYFSAYSGSRNVLDLQSDFVIGASTAGRNFGGYAAIALSENVTTTGSLTLAEDAAISFYLSQNPVMTFGGAVDGEGKTLSLYHDTTGTGKLVLQGGGTLKKLESDGTSVGVELQKAHTLTLQEGGTIAGTLTGDGEAGLAVNSGTLDVGAVSGSLGSLTLGKGVAMNVGGGSLVATTFNMEGDATLGIGKDVTLNFTNSQKAGKLTLDLTGLLAEFGGVKMVYDLFDRDTFSNWYSQFTSKGGALAFDNLGDYGYSFDEETGQITLSIQGGYYEYKGRADEPLVWDTTTEGSSTHWEGDKKWTNGSSVLFSAADYDNEVIIGSDLQVGLMQVSSGGYHFSASTGNGYTLDVESLIVDKDVTMEFGEGVRLYAGKLTVSGASSTERNEVTFNEGAEVDNFSNNTNVDYRLGSDLVIHDWEGTAADSVHFSKVEEVTDDVSVEFDFSDVESSKQITVSGYSFDGVGLRLNGGKGGDATYPPYRNTQLTFSSTSPGGESLNLPALEVKGKALLSFSGYQVTTDSLNLEMGWGDTGYGKVELYSDLEISRNGSLTVKKAATGDGVINVSQSVLTLEQGGRLGGIVLGGELVLGADLELCGFGSSYLYRRNLFLYCSSSSKISLKEGTSEAYVLYGIRDGSTSSADLTAFGERWTKPSISTANPGPGDNELQLADGIGIGIYSDTKQAYTVNNGGELAHALKIKGAVFNLNKPADAAQDYQFQKKVVVTDEGVLNVNEGVNAMFVQGLDVQGTLTLGEGANAGVGEGFLLKANQLTLAEMTQLTVGKDGKLDFVKVGFAAGVDSGTLTIDISGIVKDDPLEDGKTYQLFESAENFQGWYNTFVENGGTIRFLSDEGYDMYQLSDVLDGTITRSLENFEFDGTSDALTWGTDQADSGWKDNKDWTEKTRGNVHFTAGEGTYTVTLTSDITAEKLSVEGEGATYNVSGDHTLTLGSFVAEKKVTMDIQKGTTLVVSGDFTSNDSVSEYTFVEKLTVGGKLSLSGTGDNDGEVAKMTLKKGGSVGTFDALNKTQFTLGGDLVIGAIPVSKNEKDEDVWPPLSTSFKKDGEAAGDVYVDIQSSVTLVAGETLAAGATDPFDGVGLKASEGAEVQFAKGSNWNFGEGKLYAGADSRIVFSGGEITAGGAVIDDSTASWNYEHYGICLNDNAKLTLNGEVSGEGRLVINSGEAHLKEGGKLGGVSVSWNKSILYLGDDLELTGEIVCIDKNPGAELAVKREDGVGDMVYVLFNTGESGTSRGTLADYPRRMGFNDGVSIDNNEVGVGKSGKGTYVIEGDEEMFEDTDLSLADREELNKERNTLDWALKVKEGTLSFAARADVAKEHTLNKEVRVLDGATLELQDNARVTLADTLLMEGSATLSLGQNAFFTAENVQVSDGATLDLQNKAHVTLSGTLSLEGEAWISLGRNASLAAAKYNATGGTNGGTVNLSLTGSQKVYDGHVGQAMFLFDDFSGKIHLKLDAYELEDGMTYQIFDQERGKNFLEELKDSDQVTLEIVNDLTESGFEAKLNDKGQIEVTKKKGEDLTWNNGDKDLVWKLGGERIWDHAGDDDAVYEDGKNVIFDGSGERRTVDVQIEGKLAPLDMTVKGNGISYVFTPQSTIGDELTVERDLTLEEGSNVTFKGEMAVTVERNLYTRDRSTITLWNQDLVIKGNWHLKGSTGNDRIILRHANGAEKDAYIRFNDISSDKYFTVDDGDPNHPIEDVLYCQTGTADDQIEFNGVGIHKTGGQDLKLYCYQGGGVILDGGHLTLLSPYDSDSEEIETVVHGSVSVGTGATLTFRESAQITGSVDTKKGSTVELSATALNSAPNDPGMRYRFEGGGDMGGLLSWEGNSSLFLGADLTVGGLVGERVYKKGALTVTRPYSGKDFNFTIALTEEDPIMKEFTEFGSKVNLVVRSEDPGYRQTFWNGFVARGNVTLESGRLRLGIDDDDEHRKNEEDQESEKLDSWIDGTLEIKGGVFEEYSPRFSFVYDEIIVIPNEDKTQEPQTQTIPHKCSVIVGAKGGSQEAVFEYRVDRVPQLTIPTLTMRDNGALRPRNGAAGAKTTITALTVDTSAGAKASMDETVIDRTQVLTLQIDKLNGNGEFDFGDIGIYRQGGHVDVTIAAIDNFNGKLSGETSQDNPLKVGTINVAKDKTVDLALNTTISGAISGERGGTLKFSQPGSTYMVSGGGTTQGILELCDGTATTVDTRELTVGTLKTGEGSQLTVKSNMTIGKAVAPDPNDSKLEGKGLTSLTVGAKLAVKSGTLRAKKVTMEAGGILSVGMGGEQEGAMLDFGDITLASQARLEIELTDYGDEIEYQLFAEETFGAVWDKLMEGKEKWYDAFHITSPEITNKGLEIELRRDGVIYITPSATITWTAEASEEWTNESAAEWEGNVPPRAKSVQFTELDGVIPRNGQVVIADPDGPVTPREVIVTDGEFTFTQKEGTTGGLKITPERDSAGALTGGSLRIAPKGTLHLNLKNTSIPTVDLQGTLGLGDEEALPEGTKLQFNGGTLLYDTRGVATDVSSLVDKGNSTDHVKVQVEDEVGTAGVTWGSKRRVANSGVSLALDNGLDKSGDGLFTLAWQDDGETEHGGKITVEGSKLTLDVTTSSANGVAHLTGGADVKKDAELELKVGTGHLAMQNVTGEGVLNVSSGKVLLSGTNNVADITLANGTTTNIVGDEALGGENSTLTLNGGTVASDAAAKVQAGKVSVNADTRINGDITMTGVIEGSKSLTAATGKNAALTGDISGYTGELVTEAESRWSLSGTALNGKNGIVDNAASGDGTVYFDGPALYSGKVGGNVTLKSGEGGLVIISSHEDNSSGAKLDASEGTITLGDNVHEQAVWNGSQVVGGKIVLSDVTLAPGGLSDIGRNVDISVNTAKYEGNGTHAGVVDMNGMQGRNLQGTSLSSITINEHGQLRRVGGSFKVDRKRTAELHFSSENVGTDIKSSEEKGTNPLITGTGKDSFTFDAMSEGMTMYLETDAVSALIGCLARNGTKVGEDGVIMPVDTDVYLYLMEEGTLKMNPVDVFGSDGKIDEKKFVQFFLGDDAALLTAMDIESITVSPDGYLRFHGSVGDVFVTPETEPRDGHYVLKDDQMLESVKATVLAHKYDELHLALDGETQDTTVHNLLGITGSELYLENTHESGTEMSPDDPNRLEVTFDNTKWTDQQIKDPGQYPGVDDTTVLGQNTNFNGSLYAGENVDVRKTGKGTLSVGGTYEVDQGKTTIEEGALRLRGEENTLRDLEFAYTDPQDTAHNETNRGLLLEGGKTTITGEITDEANTADGNDIVLSKGAELTLKGNNTLNSTGIIGDEENGSGKLVLDGDKTGQGGQLTLNGEGAQLSGVDVQLGNGGTLTLGENAGMDAGEVVLNEGGTLDVGAGKANHVDSLQSAKPGKGTLKSSDGGELHVGGGSFSGTLDSSEPDSAAGKLVVDDGAEFSLDHVTTTTNDPAKGWDVQVGKGSNLTVDVSVPKNSTPKETYIGDVSVGDGNLTLKGTNPGDLQHVHGGNLTWDEDGRIVLSSDGEAVDDSFTLHFNVDKDKLDSREFQDHLDLKGAAFFTKDLIDVDPDGAGGVTLQFKTAQDNKFERVLPNMEKNAHAGATMVWEDLKDRDAMEGFFEQMQDPNSDRVKMLNGLVAMYESGATSEMEKAFAAIAGSSVSVLGPAFVQDLHRQLGAIRNRTTTMASEVSYETYDKLPMWHAWLNAEGNYHKMDSDGFAPGYTLNNWGGTVGADVDVSPATTVGFALTAMYGDLKPDATDAATGDLDTTYLSAFARTTKGAWIHTFVVSVGMADVSLNRTVNAGGVNYRTQGSTDGYAVGALYEVGYTKLMNRRGTMAFQPVFNVEIRHAAIKGYTETGSDAGLKVDDIEQDVVTFGFGARLQSIVGENVYNRTSVLEGRLLVKADIGDNTGVAKNSLIGATAVGEVESAEVGALGIEAGIGLTIPLGASAGSVFMDASAEVRSGWTSFNATVGYRINF